MALLVPRPCRPPGPGRCQPVAWLAQTCVPPHARHHRLAATHDSDGRGDDSIGAPTSSAPAALLLSLALLVTPTPAPAAFIPLEDRPPPSASAVTTPDGTIRFLPSPTPGVAAVQAALVQAWGAARAEYVDASAVAGTAWEAALQAGLDEAGAAPDAATAWTAVERLIASLGDQYTRVLRPGGGGSGAGAAAAYEADLAGQGASLGLQLAGGGAQGSAVTVAAVVPGSPAAAAGVRPGDTVVAVGGRPAATTPPADLARSLTVEADVTVRSSGGALPHTVHLVPTAVPLHAVQHATLEASEGATASSPPRRLAYLRIAAFNDLTPGDVREGLTALSRSRPDALVVDLRDNAGGSVAAAVEVAGQLLEGVGGRGGGDDSVLLARVQDGRGGEEAVAVPRPQPADRPAWAHATRPPMALLLNHGTASSSELLAGALEPSALMTVGERTFGKGRTQRAIPLTGGGLLVVSNRTFITPAGVAVDGGVGITPAVACAPQVSEAGFFVSGGVGDGGGDGDVGDAGLGERLLSDPCVRLAAERLGLKLRGAE